MTTYTPADMKTRFHDRRAIEQSWPHKADMQIHAWQ